MCGKNQRVLLEMNLDYSDKIKLKVDIKYYINMRL